MTDPRIEQLLAKATHYVHNANGLIYETPKGVLPAPALEPGLTNPTRHAYHGSGDHKLERLAMLGAKWYRDMTPHAELLFDPSVSEERAKHNNRATALTIPLITKEQATKLIFTYRQPGAKPGAHVIYTVFTKNGETELLLASPEILCATLPLVAPQLSLANLTLTRTLHYAHPADLTSDPKFQRAFAARDYLGEIRKAYANTRVLQEKARDSAKLAETARAASVANIALLEGTKITERRRATQAYDALRAAEATKEKADAEREALARERAETQRAFGELDSRDERVRKAAQETLRGRIEQMEKERDDYRTRAERTEGDLTARNAELEEAAGVVDDLATKVDKLNTRIKELGG